MNNPITEAAMLDMSEQGAVRDARGRFVPGQSGNPAGKIPGTCNRATLLRAALDSEEGPAIIDKALAGDVVTARFCLDRLEPRPRSRAIAIDLPAGAKASDVVAAFDATLRAMAVGEITPDEAVQVTRVLDGRRRAIEAVWAESARDERRNTIEPSPLGPFDKRSGGLGEGLRDASDGAGKRSSLGPHPDPLPEGEGMLRSVEVLARGTPQPPIAAAMGPLEHLSTSLSLPFDKSSGGRGARGAFGANLLHSTCISTRSPVLESIGRLGPGATSASSRIAWGFAPNITGTGSSP